MNDIPVREKQEPKSGRRAGFGMSSNPLSVKDYYTDSHGSVRRFDAKRDKRMSARQWRKQRRVTRQATKVGT